MIDNWNTWIISAHCPPMPEWLSTAKSQTQLSHSVFSKKWFYSCQYLKHLSVSTCRCSCSVIFTPSLPEWFHPSFPSLWLFPLASLAQTQSPVLQNKMLVPMATVRAGSTPPQPSISLVTPPLPVQNGTASGNKVKKLDNFNQRSIDFKSN